MEYGALVVQLVKNLPASGGDTRDVGSIQGSGRSPEEGNGNPLQYSCLAGYRPCGHKELDTTEHVHAHTYTHTHTHNGVLLSYKKKD